MTNYSKVALVIGASRGIGRRIAISLAEAGYTVIVSSKSTSEGSRSSSSPPDPNSRDSNIDTVAQEITAAGGIASAFAVDVRSESSITHLFARIGEHYGRLDALIYNSGAIWWASVEMTPVKRFKLMQEVNIDGLYFTTHAALPLIEQNGWSTRIIVVSPPIYSRFFRGKTAYAVGKVGMSVMVKGLAVDWQRLGDARRNMAITALWPAAAIQSAATEFNVPKSPHTDSNIGERERLAQLRKPTIFADACLAILRAPVEKVNGLLTIDEDFLRDVEGVKDFEKYNVVPGSKPRRMLPKVLPDLRVEEENDEGMRMDSTTIQREKAQL